MRRTHLNADPLPSIKASPRLQIGYIAKSGRSGGLNFGLRKFSPAIDAANAYQAPRFDIEGRQRQRDAATPDTGDGWPLYVATDTGASAFDQNAGTAANLRSGNSYQDLTLPFAFNFYGTSYTTVRINTNGYLQFGGPDQYYDGNDDNSLEVFQRNVRIAPLWDNIDTYANGAAGKDVFVDKSVANQVTVRWAGRVQNTTSDVNFSVTLFADGSFRFDYGAGNDGLTPTVGVSAGNGYTFVLAPYDGAANLASADSLLWNATPGLTFYDVGAYEFQGNSDDATPPQVTSISNLPAPGGTTALAFTSLQVAFSESLDGISARSPANYELMSAGVDGIFSTPDDVKIAIKPAYSFPETNLTLQLLNGVLPDGFYRLTLSGSNAIYDTAGNKLDGNGDGTGGDDYVRTFHIDRSTNTAPVATDASANVNEDGTVTITLAGTDANGDPLIYGIAANPTHGTLSALDPVTRQVIYTPSPNYNGPDSFHFRVDDSRLGIDDGVISITVAPVNDRPTAAGTSLTTTEDTPVVIALPGTDIETPRSQLVFELVAAPGNGLITLGSGGTWTYAPNANFNGTDTFTYTVRDLGDPNGASASALTSAAGTVTINVVPQNDAPTIAPIAPQSVNEGATLSFTVAATDPENDPLTWTLLTPLAGVSLNASTGLFSWTPADGPAARSFTVRVSDGTRTDEKSFDLNVLNVAPTIKASGASAIDVNTTYTINFSATDPGTDTIQSWSIAWGDGTTTANLAASATSASLVYGLGGQYGVSVTAVDEDGTFTRTNAIDLRVIRPNQVPIAAPQTVSATEDVAKNVTLAGVDLDGNPLTFAITVNPTRGTVSGFNATTGAFLYTPNANYFGADSLRFTVNDGQDTSPSALVKLNIAAVNDLPSATTQTVATDEDTPLAIQLGGIDVETASASLVYTLGTGLAHGALVQGAAGAWSYSPAANYNGPDSFTFTVTDAGAGAAVSATATITIGVAAVNDAPVAVGDAAETTAANPVTIIVLANDSDVDSAALTTVIETSPANGSVVVNAGGSVTYTRTTAGFFGTDSFTYRASDGSATSAPATVTITVKAPVTPPPVGVDDSFTAQEDTVIHGDVLANDTDPDTPLSSLTAILVSAPPAGAGVVVLDSNGTFTFTPVANFTGSTSFTYKAYDGSTLSAATTVTLELTPVNDPPVAQPDVFAGTEDIAVTGNVLANDSDVDSAALTAQLVAGPATGGLVFNGDGSFTYTPVANANGPVTFTYRVSDDSATSGTTLVTLNLAPVNDAPTATPDSFTRPEDTVISGNVLANDSDLDGNPLTVSLVTGPANGGLVLNPNGGFVYTPTANYFGPDSFTYRASDGSLQSAITTVSLTLTPVNDVPVGKPDSFTGPEDVAITGNVLANDTDVETQPTPGGVINLGAELVSGPANGTLAFNPDGTFVFTPDANFAGSTSFVYRASDGSATSGPTTVSLNLTPVNDAPVIAGVDDRAVGEGDAVDIEISVIDPDAGDTRVFELVNGPADAVLTPDGHFQWTAPAGAPVAPGNVFDVTVRVTDAAGAADTESFSLTVEPIPLRVVSLTPGTSGFSVRFNRPVETSQINLYSDTDRPAPVLGAPDIRVQAVGATRPLSGSVVFDADKQGFTWVRTGAAFNGGSYDIRLSAAANGFIDQTSAHRRLDGDQDGIAGDDFVTRITIAAPAGIRTLSLPDFMRGPGQPVELQNAGLPLTLSDGAGVRSVRVDIAHSESLLAIGGFTLSASALAAGGIATLTTTPDVTTLTVTFTTALGAGPVALGRLSATVPTTAAYGAGQVLDLRNVVITGNGGGTIAARADDAYQLVGYLGDATGNGAYTTLDLARMQPVFARMSTPGGYNVGFGAWRLSDPLLVGDVNGNGSFNAIDQLRLFQHLNGASAATTGIPVLPPGAVPLTFAGPDPVVSIGSNPTGTSGGTVIVPVNLDLAAGLESAQIEIGYDPTVLEVVMVRKGSLTSDFQWFIVKQEAGLIRIDTSRIGALDGGTGSLVDIEFRIRADVSSGTSSTRVDLRNATLNDSRLTLNPAPRPGPDATDGSIGIRPPTVSRNSGAPGGVDWTRTFEIRRKTGEHTPPPTFAEWMNAAWAKDLTDRLAAPAGSEGTDKPRTGLAGRDLLRNLSRSFR